MNNDNNEVTAYQELLEDIADSGHKELTLSRIRTVFSAGIFIIILVAAILIVPRVSTALKTVQDAASNLNKVASELDGSLTGLEELINGANTMVSTNNQNVTDALNNFNSIKFDELNSAIQDLSDVVAPLANFTNSFR